MAENKLSRLPKMDLLLARRELAEQVGGSAFHFSGGHLENNYDWSGTTDLTAETLEEASRVEIQLYPSDPFSLSDSGPLDDGAALIPVEGTERSLEEDEVKELASLVYAEGYSDEPMDLLFIDGETWFIPEENVERVSEIIYG